MFNEGKLTIFVDGHERREIDARCYTASEAMGVIQHCLDSLQHGLRTNLAGDIDVLRAFAQVDRSIRLYRTFCYAEAETGPVTVIQVHQRGGALDLTMARLRDSSEKRILAWCAHHEGRPSAYGLPRLLWSRTYNWLDDRTPEYILRGVSASVAEDLRAAYQAFTAAVSAAA